MLCLNPKITVYITNYCQYSCDYCFFKEMNLLNTEQLSSDILDKMVYYFSKYQVPLIAICGGDPLLHPNLIDFTKRLSDNGNYPIIATNAIDVSIDYLGELKNSGVRYLQIGLDSLDSSKLNNFKEENHLEKVKKSINKIKKVGLEFGFSMCVSHKNFHELIEVASYAKHVGANLLKVAKYKGNNKLYCLTQEEELQLIRFVELFNKESVFIRYSGTPETIDFKTDYPPLTIFSNGDMVDERNGESIGSIMSDDPAKAYNNYLNKLQKRGQYEKI
ncbi:TPA: radical SAM protein [Streptococcus suis]|uniref:radical SAM protein n=1 Tax=Streptococcus suis TaxID=1307 RepID=UPI001915089E|nr:radical SAM protein [Streptococcus suis]HEL1793440.1 radical SAM protein [Streptococcus suis]HEL1795472.1 radical SAM protein [Streptococcus suis]HEL1921459.1 radical SAM protein [Streptococcus suis]HEL2139853.1 radical SAM protein [Streptococcus suis]